MRPARRARTATPPTTPPTMAPVLEDEEDEGVDVEEEEELVDEVLVAFVKCVVLNRV